MSSNGTRLVPLSYLLERRDVEKVEKGPLDEDACLVEYSDVARGVGVLLRPEKVSSVGSDKVELPAGSLVFGRLDPDSGRIFLVPKEGRFVGSTEFIPLVVREGSVRKAFIQRMLLLPEIQSGLGMLKSGKCQQRADLDKLLQCRVPLPNLDEQDNCLADTKELWDEIEKLARSIPTFQEIVDRQLQSVLRCAVPMIHCVGEISIHTVVFSKLLRNGFRFLAMSKSFEEMLASVGNTVPLSRLASVRGGKRLKKGTQYENTDTGFQYLRGGDIGNDRVKIEQVVSISEEAFRQIERFAAVDGDIAITIAGVVGKVALLHPQSPTGVTENIALLKVLNEEELLPQFLVYILLSSFMQFQMKKEMSELRQQKLSLEKLRALRIPAPPAKHIQQDVLRRIQEEFNVIHQLAIRMNVLKAEHDACLRKVLGASSVEFIDNKLLEGVADPVDEDEEQIESIED